MTTTRYLPGGDREIDPDKKRNYSNYMPWFVRYKLQQLKEKEEAAKVAKGVR